MLRCRGRVVVMGMGKSGHVGRKIAATLASTGTPSFFVHPAEAAHGDLGRISRDDVVIALSNSGETEGATKASLLKDEVVAEAPPPKPVAAPAPARRPSCGVRDHLWTS